MVLTKDRLKELLNYNPDTGIFTRLTAPTNKVKIGDVSGSINKKGYIEIKVDYKKYLAHRLAHLYMTGNFPKNQIDHIDGIKNNNAWTNLRDVTPAENSQNRRTAKKNNKSGLLGVYTNSNCSTYRSQIWINGVCKQLGSFKTKEQAHAAYLKEKRIHHKTCSI